MESIQSTQTPAIGLKEDGDAKSTEASFGPRVYQVVVFAVVFGTLLPVFLHHRQHGVVNAHQFGLTFFYWLNSIIAFWEICLFFRIKLIEEQHKDFSARYRGRELDRVKDFFSRKLKLREVFSMNTWAEIWSSYSIFDDSYANRRSYGFFIDIGNGFSTLVPSLMLAYGMTFHLISARMLGFVGLIACYQMWYGTVLYFTSFVFNKRYVGHSWMNLAIFVGLSNGIWFGFPLWGMWASVQMISNDSYSLFLS